MIAWVLGEYARLASVDGYSIEDIADLLSECIERPRTLHVFEASCEAIAMIAHTKRHGVR